MYECRLLQSFLALEGSVGTVTDDQSMYRSVECKNRKDKMTLSVRGNVRLFLIFF